MGSSGSEAVWMQDGSYVDLVGFDISAGSRLGVENNGSNVRILGNYVHNIAGSCSSSGGAGIDNSNYSASNDDIIGNIVGNIGPSNNGSCNTVQGIYLSNSGGITANNIVFAVSAWGIQMWHAATNATIVNNTVFNCYGGIIVGAGDSPGGVTADNTLVANNIVYKNIGYGIDEYGATGTHNRYMNNLVTGNPTEISLQNGLSATGTVTADPQFVNYQANGTGDYHLKSTSPAINAGTSTSAPATDFSGGTPTCRRSLGHRRIRVWRHRGYLALVLSLRTRAIQTESLREQQTDLYRRSVLLCGRFLHNRQVGRPSKSPRQSAGLPALR